MPRAILVLRENSVYLYDKNGDGERERERARRIKWICLRLSVCRRLAGYGDGGDDLFLYTFAERRKGREETKDLDASRRVVEWSGCF